MTELERVKKDLDLATRVAAEAILLMTPEQRAKLREKMDGLKEAV